MRTLCNTVAFGSQLPWEMDHIFFFFFLTITERESEGGLFSQWWVPDGRSPSVVMTTSARTRFIPVFTSV